MLFYILFFIILCISVLLGLFVGLWILKDREGCDKKFVKCEYRKCPDEEDPDCNDPDEYSTGEEEVELDTEKTGEAQEEEKKSLVTAIKSAFRNKFAAIRSVFKKKDKKGAFTSKLKASENYESMMEFNCAADNIDYDEYVKTLQKKQEKAYDTLR